ncbi:amino acid adenylation domain-containing protein [Actinoplanes sp. NPDC051851]|uniref:amino acid adenylation domain-containing protein n=1 Tax=Actinoplanes sp. NPDC051851 TaxID=3154753 RepID=UPI00341FEDE2
MSDDPGGRRLPLTAAQHGVWYALRLDPGTTAYDIGGYADVRGPLDPDLLETACAAVAGEAGALRVRFDDTGPEVVQIIDPERRPPVSRVDLSGGPGPEEAARRWLREWFTVPRDPVRDPLAEFALLRLAPDRHWWCPRGHHLVLDGYSMPLLCGRIAELYTALLEERTARQSPFRPYELLVAAEREYPGSGAYEKDRLFWHERLAGSAAAPTLSGRGPLPPGPVHRRTIRLPRAATGAPGSWGERTVAGLAGYVGRLTGARELCLAVPFAARQGDLLRIPGHTANVLPLRLAVLPEATPGELTALVAVELAAARRHQRYRGEQLAREIGDRSGPAVNIKFFDYRLAFGPAEAVLQSVAAGPVDDLTLSVRQDGDDLVLDLDAHAGAYTAAETEGHLRGLGEFLSGAADFGGTAGVRGTGGHAHGRVLPDRPVPFAAAFAAQVRRTPDAVALRDGARSWTFAALDAAAGALAGALREAGAGPERLVALALERSAEVVIGMLATARAGAAWLPLDLGQPAGRLDRLLRDARPAVVLTADPARPAVTPPPGAVPLAAGAVAGEPPEPARAARPENLAYAIYTSGSTGVPKAVQVTQRGLAALLAGHRDGIMASVPAGRRLRIAHTAPLTFDAGLDPLLWMIAGHELVLVGAETYRDPAALVRLVRAERIDYLDTTPSHLALLLDAGLLDGGHRPSVLVFGGEAAPGSLWGRLRDVRAVNAYGPTEYTVDALQAVVAENPRPVLGEPVAGARVVVLDSRLRPVPEGGVGELYLGGPGLARGYAGRAGETAARLVADPHGRGRLFRTGDVVRLRIGGGLEYLGRSDDQVKIRGFRAEPGEAEAVLTGHPGVRQAVVLPRRTPGGTVLAAYVVARDGEPGDLTGYARERLPDYLVPATITVLDALPLTVNGKLDVAALPEPGTDGTIGHREPATEAERVVAGLVGDVLGAATVGADDDFFALGGHSLTAARLAGLIRERFGVEIDLRAVFDGRTVAALARTVESARGSERPAPVPHAATGRVPLSAAQQRFWFAHRLDPADAAYHIPFVITFDGLVDADRLAVALGALLARHETLRTLVAEDADGAWQRVLEPGDPLLAGVLRVGSDDPIREPFDLTRQPPVRATLLRGPEVDTLVLVVHHIAGDQGSARTMLADLGAAYAGAALEPVPLTYRDYTVWHAELLEHASLASTQLDFWRDALDGLPDEVSLARNRSTDGPGPGGEVTAEVGAAAHDRIRRLARERGVTTFAVLHAAVAIVLDAYGAGPDLPLGTPVAGRPDPALDDLVGCFLNTVVLRTDLGGNPTAGELLDRVQRVGVAAFAHADVPFERVADALTPPRVPGRHPLFQIMIVHEYAVAEVLRLGAVSGPAVLTGTGAAKTDLVVKLAERPDGGGIAIRLEYATALIDRALVTGIAAALRRVLTALPDRVASPISRLGVLPPGLVPDARGPDVPLSPATVPELFSAAAARHPGRVALVDDATGEQLTYAELDARIERAADELRERGTGPGEIVAVRLPRSVELVVSVYAAQRVGAAYLPLDPEQPAERTADMLDDARAVPGVGDAAYVIFTSGSTGRPKGVVVPHRAVVNRLLWMQDAYPLGADDVVLQKTPLTFDVSVWELFWPLLTGATLVLAAPDGHRDPAYLIGVIHRRRVTTLHFVPSMLAAFLTDPDVRSCEGVRRVFCSGEALPATLVARFRAALPAELHNLYGPTEAAVDVTAWRVTGADVPIGRPVWNTGVHVLDRFLRPVPEGVAGELYLSGAQLADGYLARPGLTATRFVASPWHVGKRLYRTGDLARLRSDGALDYLGRTDDQVKIRGVRVELGEVEAALRRHAGVREAAAATRVDDAGNVRLTGFVVPAPGVTLEPDEVRGFLGTVVPAALVPSAVRVLDALPLTPSGKLDRRALPTAPPHRSAVPVTVGPVAVGPVTVGPVSAGPVAVGPRGIADSAEQVVRRVFAQVLERDDVDGETGFFALGGDSILAIQVVNRVRAAGLRIQVRDVFTHQNAAALAAAASPVTAPAAGAVVAAAEGVVELTPIMHRLREQGGLDDAVQTASIGLPAGTGLDALTAAVQVLLDRHPMLRAQLIVSGHGHWTLSVPSSADAVPATDLVRAGERVAPDPRRGHTSRWCLLSDGGTRVVAGVHHLAVDTVSWGVIEAELRAALAGEPLPAVSSVPFRAWAARLRESAADPGVLDEYGYWLAVAADPLPNLPVATARDTAARDTAARDTAARDTAPAELRVPGRVFAPLWEWAARRHRFTGEDLLLAAVTLATAAARGDDRDTSVLIERHGRDGDDVAGTVGWFTTLYPVRVRPGGSPVAVLKSVKEALRAVPGAGAGFGLLRYLNPQTSAGLAAAGEPDLLVNFLGHRSGALDLDGSTPADPVELLAYTVDGPDGRELRAVLIGPADRDLVRYRDALAEAFAALAGEVAADEPGGRTPSDLTLPGLAQSDLDDLDAHEPGWLDVLPATPLQEGLTALAEARFRDGGTHPDVYTVQLRLRFAAVGGAGRMRDAVGGAGRMRDAMGGAGLDAGRMRDAATAVFGRHLGLRLGLRPLASGRVVAVLHPAGPVDVAEHRLDEAGLAALARRRRHEPFDLARPPLFRFDLVAGAEGGETLIITGHHAAWDGWSAPLLVGELLAVYAGREPGPDGSAAHLAYLREFARRDPAVDLAAWRDLLGGTAGPTLLCPAAAAAGAALPAEIRAELPEPLVDALRRRAGARGLTLNTLIQGAWGILLAGRTGERDTVFGVTVSGRPPQPDGLDRAVGLFVNTVPARCEIRAGDTAGDVLARLQDRQAAAADHHRAGLAGIQRAVGRGTLFDTLVVFENYPLDEAALLGPAGGAELGLVAIEADDATHYPVTLTVFPGERIGLALGYRADALDEQGARGLLDDLRDTLETFAAGLNAPLPTIRLLAGPHGSVGALETPVGTSQEGEVRLLAGTQGSVGSPDTPVRTSQEGEGGGRVAEVLAGLFAEVLEVPDVRVGDGFLALGGDSILAIQLVARARAVGLRFTAADVFEHRTAAGLAAVVAGNEAVAAGGGREPVRAAAVSFAGAQVTPIVHWLRERGGPVGTYCQRMVLRLPADATGERLVDAVQRVLDRHPMLRARLDGAGLSAPPPGSVRAGELFTTVRGAADVEGATGTAAREIDPAAGSCTRWVWFERDRQLLVVAHHLVVDGVSWRVLTADLASAWHGTPLPPIGTGYDEWTRLLAAEARTGRRRAELDHWRQALRAPSPFPGLRLDPGLDVAATRRELSFAVEGAGDEGVEALLLDALVRALPGDGRARDVAVLLEGHGRADDVVPADLSRTVGWFTTMYPVRVGPGAEAAAALAAVPDRGIGYGLLRYLDPGPGAGLRELDEPQVRLNYLGRFTAGGGRAFAPVDAADPVGGHVDPALPIPVAMDVTAVGGANGLIVRVAWAGRHLDDDTVRAFADRFRTALGDAKKDVPGDGEKDVPGAGEKDVLVEIGDDELDELWRNG